MTAFQDLSLPRSRTMVLPVLLVVVVEAVLWILFIMPKCVWAIPIDMYKYASGETGLRPISRGGCYSIIRMLFLHLNSKNWPRLLCKVPSVSAFTFYVSWIEIPEQLSATVSHRAGRVIWCVFYVRERWILSQLSFPFGGGKYIYCKLVLGICPISYHHISTPLKFSLIQALKGRILQIWCFPCLSPQVLYNTNMRGSWTCVTIIILFFSNKMALV